MLCIHSVGNFIVCILSIHLHANLWVGTHLKKLHFNHRVSKSTPRAIQVLKNYNYCMIRMQWLYGNILLQYLGLAGILLISCKESSRLGGKWTEWKGSFITSFELIKIIVFWRYFVRGFWSKLIKWTMSTNCSAWFCLMQINRWTVQHLVPFPTQNGTCKNIAKLQLILIFWERFYVLWTCVVATDWMAPP